jgi:hypothetical protein
VSTRAIQHPPKLLFAALDFSPDEVIIPQLMKHGNRKEAGRAPDAFVTAMHIALLTAAGAALFAAIGVVILLARRFENAPQAELADTAIQGEVAVAS